MSQKDTYLLIFLCAILCLIISNCVSSNKKVDLIFRVNVSDLDDVQRVHLVGSRPLLSQENPLPLTKTENAYTVVISFPDSLIDKPMRYRFVVNDSIYENDGYGPRQLLLPSKSTTLPIVEFNDKIGSTGKWISRSSPIPVGRTNTPEEEFYFSQPFVGVTNAGIPQNGLFPIKETGVSTLPVKSAVESYLASLTDAQKARTLFDIDDDEWRKWHNIEIYERQGVGLEEMNEDQKKLAFGILDASLSARGIEKTRSVMKMEDYLSLMSRKYVTDEAADAFGSEKYFFTIMGTPSESEPWGWQIDGHHIVINYFVLGDQVVMTPTFLGSEPTYIEEGPNKGLRTFQAEDKKGIAFYKQLNDEQRKQATLLDKKEYNFIQAEAFKDNYVIPFVGLRVNDLSEKQNLLFIELLEEYIGNMTAGHAAVRMEEIKAHLDETYFSWVGKYGKGDPFYYRIHSPVVLIEFDNQEPVFMWDRNGLKPGPGKNHTHTIVRTPNGNDYGKDLLRQHLEEHHSGG